MELPQCSGFAVKPQKSKLTAVVLIFQVLQKKIIYFIELLYFNIEKTSSEGKNIVRTLSLAMIVLTSKRIAVEIHT